MNLFGSQSSAPNASSSLRDSLLDRGPGQNTYTTISIPAFLSRAPIIPGTESEGIQRRETCAEGAKTATKTFFIYAIIGLIGAILVKGLASILAVTVIVLFILFLLLTGSGMVAVNWDNVGGAMLKTVDRDGDGKIGWNDFKAWVVDLLAFLSSRGIPALAGLGFGALAGFYFTAHVL